MRRTLFCPTSQKSARVPSGGGQYTVWSSALSNLARGSSPSLPTSRLNAPSGAQRFPTRYVHDSGVSMTCLNTPSGAQCFSTKENPMTHVITPFTSQCTFWRSVLSDPRDGGLVAPDRLQVSMHLLVLSAFRLLPQKTAPQRRLPERNRRRPGKHHIESARTRPIKPHNREKPPQTTPAPPTPPTSRYATGFQRTQAKNRPLTTTPR